jgi:NADH-quinone oxidoreductase subunit N
VNDATVQALIAWVPLVLPEALLLAGACVLFLGGIFRPDRHLWGTVALAVLVLAGLVVWLLPRGPTDRATLFASPILADQLVLFVRILALVGGAILVLVSWNEVPDRQAAEYHACLLIVVAGTGLTASANELITLFLALEMVSIPTYVLLYLPRHDIAAQEAALKYFLLSVFSSALLLFGFSYLYGLGGTTNLPALAQTFSMAQAGSQGGLPGAAMIALVMVVAGLGFKITAVPFHFYAPDVYQGAPTAVAAFLAYVPKLAGFVALVRLLGFAPAAELLGDPRHPVVPGFVLGPQVSMLFWILAVVTMTLGNMLALLQDNLKRLLAYSSVAHAGYMLIGLAVAPYLWSSAGSPVPGGVEAVLFYLGAYGAMTIGAFAVIGYLNTPEQPVETVDDLAGLSRSRPLLALLMSVFLFSLIGMPLTAGFAGKLWLFLGALAVQPEPPDHPWLFLVLALIGAINAAIGAWYYLRICAVMYLRNPLKQIAEHRAWPALTAIVACAVITLVLGIYPWALLAPAEQAVPRMARAER